MSSLLGERLPVTAFDQPGAEFGTVVNRLVRATGYKLVRDVNYLQVFCCEALGHDWAIRAKISA
jgi:hypothetical protein